MRFCNFTIYAHLMTRDGLAWTLFDESYWWGLGTRSIFYASLALELEPSNHLFTPCAVALKLQ